MAILLIASLILNGFLVCLVWRRFRAEREVIDDILKLSASEKRYVILAMNNQKIDPGSDFSEIDVLEGLSERGWLFPMADGTYQGGPTTKAEYLARRLA